MKATPFFVLALVCSACSRESILDKREVLERQTWWDNRDWDWYEEKIPFFESPDPDIDATYYYRWELLTKHLVYGSPETGYTFTEFIDRPFWAGRYGSISCPLGHQFYEVRWLHDPRVIEDFARYWFETPGAEPRSYSNWYGDAMWATYLVLYDEDFIRAALPHMETQYAGWIDEHWDPDHRMFRWDGMHDGMETNINSRQTADTFAGAEGYRPTLNSYLYADASAISKAAALLGDTAKAQRYGQRARALKQQVQEELWDERRTFFLHQFAHDEVNGIRAKSRTYETGLYRGSPHGRELIGYVPWQFNLPDPGYEAAWRYLMDPEYFYAPYGPTTVERNDPQFYVSPRCCVWSGNAWPYATTQTLVALANLLNNYEQSVVDRDDYFRLLETYTRSQRKDGRPYIAEAADPESGSWEGHDTFYHSEHYLHSGYVDLIITGLVGLRPRDDDTLEVNPLAPEDWDFFALEDVSYHGRRLSVVWDRDGTRYGRGAGLSLFVDGRAIANSDSLRRMTAPLRPRRAQERGPRHHNFAVNNGGYFPLATASYSAPEHPPLYAVDGNYWYHASPPNRWTTTGTHNLSDWFEVDFGVPRRIETVKLYFLDDGDGVVAPEDYQVQMWYDGSWVDIPAQRRTPWTPTGHRANVVSFSMIETSKIRAVFTHRRGSATGLTEFEVWGHGDLPLSEPTAPVRNIAFNAMGTGYPRATASFTAPEARVEQVNDMQFGFTRYSRNRWSARRSRNTSDWVQIDFGASRTVGRLDLYLFGDAERGEKAPRDFRVQYWNGEGWRDAVLRSRFPQRPTAWARNTVTVDPVVTDRIRVVFEHDPPAFTGVTELMIWEDDL
jgi:hypothetical protein